MPALTALLVTVSLATGADPVGSPIVLTSHSNCAAPEACAPGCNPCAKDCNPCNPCETACDPCNPCGQCTACCDPCCWCANGCKWSPVCKYSLCGMYPHYPYFPECHGYYYFRPYNWIHIDRHRLTIPGEDFKDPYSNKVFDQLSSELGDGVDSDQTLPPLTSGVALPALEALLGN